MGYALDRRKQLGMEDTISYAQKRRKQLADTQNAENKQGFTQLMTALNPDKKLNPIALEQFKPAPIKPIDYSQPVTINGKTFEPWGDGGIDNMDVSDELKTQLKQGRKEAEIKAREDFVNKEVEWKNFAEKHPILAGLQKGVDEVIRKPFDKIGEGTQAVLGGEVQNTIPEIQGEKTTGNNAVDTILKGTGNIIGYVGMPEMGGASGLSNLTKGTEYALTKAIPKVMAKPILNKAIQGAVESLPYSLQQSSLENENLPDSLKTAGINAGLGFGLGGLVGAGGELINKLRKPLVKEVPQLVKSETLPKSLESPSEPLNDRISALKPKEPLLPINEPLKLNKADLPPVSKFRTNTIERSNNIPDDVKKVLEPGEFDFIRETKDEWANNAVMNISKDRDKVMNDIINAKSISGGTQAHEAALLSHDLLQEAQATGDYTKYKDFLKTVAEKTRETARALKATDTAWEKKTVDGAIMEAQRVVNNVEDDVLKTNPKLMKNIDNDTSKIVEELKKAHQQAIDDLIAEHKQTMNEMPWLDKNYFSDTAKKTGFDKARSWVDSQEQAAKARIADYFKGTRLNSGLPLDLMGDMAIVGASKITKGAITLTEWSTAMVKEFGENVKPHLDEIFAKSKKLINTKVSEFAPKSNESILAGKIGSTLNEGKKTVVNDMVNELFRVAKESPLPEKVASAKRNPIEILEKAIQNKGEYADVWEKAKELVKTKYKSDEESLKILNDYFDKGIVPTYSQTTLNNSIDVALKGLGKKLTDIAKSDNKEVALKELTEYLVNKTGATSEESTLLADRIQTRFNELVKTKSQQVLKNMFKEIPKKGQKSTYEKVMELINLGAYDDNAIRDIIKQKNGLPVLENSDIQKISEYMNNAQNSEGYMKTMWQTKAQQLIADKVPATLKEKFRGLQRISLIANPKTLITRNPIGNAILGTAENIKDVPGAIIDKGVSLFTKERTTALNPLTKLKGQAEGFKQGLSEFGKDIKYGVDTSPSRGQFELPNKRIFKNPVLNAIDQFERKALQLGDRPFYQSAYNGRIAELKKLGRTIDEKAIEEAKLYALDRVFQNDSNLSKSAKHIKEGLGWLGEVAIPFTQTPANVMDKLLDYTPVGLGKAMSQFGSVAKGTFNQKLFVDRLGRTLTGTGILTLGYVLAKKGIITGGRNPDKDVANFEQSLGKSPYAFKLGDTYFTFDWAQPISGLLAAGADAYKAGSDKNDFISQVTAGATAAGNTMLNQSFLQGLLGLVNTYSPVGGIIKTATEAPLQAAPTFTSNIAKLIDPNVRETYDSNPLKQTANKFIAKIPFASMTLPKKIDSMGNEVLQQQGANIGQKAFNLFLNPGMLTSFKPNEAQKEILRLYEESGLKTQFPTMVDKTIDKTKYHPQINLTSEQYSWLQKRTGQLTMEGEKKLKGFDDVIGTSKYKNIKKTKDKSADELKAKILSDIIEESKAQATKELLKQLGYSK